MTDTLKFTKTERNTKQEFHGVDVITDAHMVLYDGDDAFGQTHYINITSELGGYSAQVDGRLDDNAMQNINHFAETIRDDITFTALDDNNDDTLFERDTDVDNIIDRLENAFVNTAFRIVYKFYAQATHESNLIKDVTRKDYIAGSDLPVKSHILVFRDPDNHDSTVINIFSTHDNMIFRTNFALRDYMLDTRKSFDKALDNALLARFDRGHVKDITKAFLDYRETVKDLLVDIGYRAVTSVKLDLNSEENH